ncbi:hypothetical protein LTR95_016264 [Oleoguttula sp. CCFEE 5521]
MVDFFYSNDYKDKDSEVELSISVFHLAEEYAVEPLENLAWQKLGDWLDLTWYGQEVALAVKLIYARDPIDKTALKEVVLELIRKSINAFLEDLDAYPHFQRAILSTPGFLIDVLSGQHIVQKPAATSSHIMRMVCPIHNECARQGDVPLMVASMSKAGEVLVCCPAEKDAMPGGFDIWGEFVTNQDCSSP